MLFKRLILSLLLMINDRCPLLHLFVLLILKSLLQPLVDPEEPLVEGHFFKLCLFEKFLLIDFNSEFGILLAEQNLDWQNKQSEELLFRVPFQAFPWLWNRGIWWIIVCSDHRGAEHRIICWFANETASLAVDMDTCTIIPIIYWFYIWIPYIHHKSLGSTQHDS